MLYDMRKTIEREIRNLDKIRCNTDETVDRAACLGAAIALSWIAGGTGCIAPSAYISALFKEKK